MARLITKMFRGVRIACGMWMIADQSDDHGDYNHDHAESQVDQENVLIGNGEGDLVVEEGGKDGEVGQDPDHDDHRVADHQGKTGCWGQP